MSYYIQKLEVNKQKSPFLIATVSDAAKETLRSKLGLKFMQIYPFQLKRTRMMNDNLSAIFIFVFNLKSGK